MKTNETKQERILWSNLQSLSKFGPKVISNWFGPLFLESDPWYQAIHEILLWNPYTYSMQLGDSRRNIFFVFTINHSLHLEVLLIEYRTIPDLPLKSVSLYCFDQLLSKVQNLLACLFVFYKSVTTSIWW